MLCARWKAFIAGYHNKSIAAMPHIVFNVADRPELFSGKWFRRHHVRVMLSVTTNRMAMPTKAARGTEATRPCSADEWLCNKRIVH